VLSGLSALCSDLYSSHDATFKETHLLEFLRKQRYKLFGICSKPSRRNDIPKSEETREIMSSLGAETFNETHSLEFRSKQGYKLFDMFSRPSGNDVETSEETRGDNDDTVSVRPESVARRLHQGHQPPMYTQGIRCGAALFPKVTADSGPCTIKSESLTYGNSQRFQHFRSLVGSGIENQLRVASDTSSGASQNHNKPNFSASIDSSMSAGKQKTVSWKREGTK
jgi:hypothetical protein